MRPCKVAGVVRMVGSVVEANPIIATPASNNRIDAAREVRVKGNAWRSPTAKNITKGPLIRKAAVMMYPCGPSASPLGQSVLDRPSGSHPRPRMKSYSISVRIIRTPPNSTEPTVPARAAAFLMRSLNRHSSLEYIRVREARCIEKFVDSIDSNDGASSRCADACRDAAAAFRQQEKNRIGGFQFHR